MICLLGSKIISLTPSTQAANNTGIEIKKLNFAESTLENPKNLAHEIVIPDRLVPGIKARTWANPINNAFLLDIFLLNSIVTFVLSEKYNTIEKNNVAKATTFTS